MPAPPSEVSHRTHDGRPTPLSPALRRDLLRLKRGLPFLLLLVPVAGLFGAAYFSAGLLLGPQGRWTKPLAPAARFGLSPRTVSFTSQDGIPLKAWWEQVWAGTAPKGTVILAHGSQMSKTGMGFTAGTLLPRGYNVLIPDLRAHGESGGTYSTFGYKESLDVLAAIRWVRRQGHRELIALVGYSAGAVAALYAAAESHDVAAVVADSAYASATDVLTREADHLTHSASASGVAWDDHLRLWLFTAPGMGGLSQWMFRLRSGVPLEPPGAGITDAVGRIDKSQVLYAAADRDPVVPRKVTEKLFRTTATPKKQLVFFHGSFHSAVACDPRGYIDTVAAFLDQATAGDR